MSTKFNSFLSTLGGFQQPPTGPLTPQQQMQQRGARNRGLSEVLYTLSDVIGDIRGQDIDFQQRSLGRQRLREQQEEEQRRKSALQNLVATNPNMAQIAQYIEADLPPSLYQYTLDQSETPDLTQIERDRAKLIELEEIPLGARTQQDNKQITLLEQSIYGTPRVIPFYDEEGSVAKSITSRDLSKNPNLVKQLESQGLYTIGQSPSTQVKGKKSLITQMSDDYLKVQSQINTYNDLASIIEENKDTFTLAGTVADFVNSGRYQIKSANRLLQLEKLEQGNPVEYSKLLGSLDKYGEQLDKLSQDRAVAKSIFLKLAYGVAKEIDPSGRLSDNDVRIAKEIIGQLGPNVKANLAVLENLAKTSARDYQSKYEEGFKNLTREEDKIRARNYTEIPQFLDGRNWRESFGNQGETTGRRTVDDILNDSSY